MVKSIEETIEDKTKEELKSLDIRFFRKTDSINEEIDSALKEYPSKEGGQGGNRPDIKLLLQDESLRKIPVMIEIKGIKDKLEKHKNGLSKNAKNYALNGAVHYANAILDCTHSYNEVIAVGINGYKRQDGTIKTEHAFYYLNRENLSMPKKIGDFSDLSCFSKTHLKDFFKKIDNLKLSEKEKEECIRDLESETEKRLNALNQFLHDELLNVNPNQRVALLVGMIMAAQGVKDKVAPLKVEDLKGNQGDASNDGKIFIDKISDFLSDKNLPKEKIALVINDLESAFIHSKLWQNTSYKNELNYNVDETPLKKTYHKVFFEILPLVKKLQTADIAGRLFNSLTKWLQVPDGEKNDVVLTPRYVVDLMVALCRVNKDSYVWDYATGSGAFLISAMNAMIKDCDKLTSPKEKDAKIAHIKAFQLLGIEKRTDIYLLGILNMILLDDGSANLLHKDSLKDFNGTYEQGDKKGQDFPADVFLLNPPYSADGKGFIFVERALKKMQKGRAAVIIQENAGSGNGLPYTKEILAHSTLLASIKMPIDLFVGRSSVQTAIYVFEVGTPHNEKAKVKFIDFSNDGYARAARKKASEKVNLRDADNAKARYEELANVVNYGSSYLNYYKDCFIEDTIATKGDLAGKDFTYAQHKMIDTKPKLEDFKKCVGEYLAWEVSTVLKNQNKSRPGEFKSPRLEELERQFKQNGGEWREFKIGDLFESQNGDFDIQKKHLNDKGHLVVSSGLENTGVVGKTDIKAKIFPKHTITCDMFGNVFYRDFDYKMVTHARVFSLSFLNKEFNKKSALYVVVAMNHLKYKFSYSNMASFKKIKKEKIFLPTKNGAIDFDFMENFIKELEEDRIKELEAYLLVAGLKDTQLSTEEKTALKIFAKLLNNGGGGLNSPLLPPEIHFAENIKLTQFKISDLFYCKRGTRLVKTHRIAGNIPLITAGKFNQGVKEFINNNKQEIFSNAITIDMFCNSFVHTKPFCCDDNILVLNAKNPMSRHCMLFISTIINKDKEKWGYGKQYRINSFEKHFITLPTQNGAIDFDFMENFIKALEKESIKAVESFHTARLKAHKTIIQKNQT